MRPNYTLSGKKLPDDYTPSEYSAAIFFGLNKLHNRGERHMYEGTVVPKRKHNKIRRANKKYSRLEKIAKRATTVYRKSMTE